VEMEQDAGVRLPGTRRRALAAKAAADGMDISPALFEQLLRLAAA
jgi:(2R)-3-sulfolactate dehydrogenase (NADP+)